MVRPITVGLNGSAESLAAAHWAAREAQLRHVPLRLLYAWEQLPPHLAPSVGESGFPQWLDRMLGEAGAELEARYPGLQITADQVENQPVPALLEAAKESELLVHGSRGLGSIAGFLAGSVSLGVVARAERPVVLVRAEQAGGDQRDIVVGLDLEHPCEPVLEFAFDAAAVHTASLRAIRVWRTVPLYGGYLADGVTPQTFAEIETVAWNTLQTALRPWREKYPYVAVRGDLVSGNAAQELIQAASDAALLVVGRRTRRPPMGTRLGAVAHSVIHHAACPVAVVPHD
jgi:nucleotide-binding universal stress UspA family protein